MHLVAHVVHVQAVLNSYYILFLHRIRMAKERIVKELKYVVSNILDTDRIQKQ